METEKIKKIFFDENFKPVLQKNRNGVKIYYSNSKTIRYELTFKYIFNSIFSITQRDLLNEKERFYSPFSILFVKLKQLMFVDKKHFNCNKKSYIVLNTLIDNMIIS